LANYPRSILCPLPWRTPDAWANMERERSVRDFAEALRSGQILLMDGAMGTELQRAGIADGECYEACNLARPEIVREIHRSYVAAGARVLVTNTFQANPVALSRHRQEEDLIRIIEAGIMLARSALTGNGWVFADIGPSSHPEPLAIASILDPCTGVDGILLETFSDPAEAALFIRVNASLPKPKPALLSFTFDGATMRTFRDVSPEDCAQAAKAMDVVALGVNCGREMTIEKCAEVLTRYRAVASLPLFARVNAGTPRNGVYTPSPGDMAACLPSLLKAGAVMVGGCCGTTPEYIAAFRDVLNTYKRDACTTA
jgi:methionine synthase I (cobalamin-dependent)